mmetsp:Transcript_2978/g.6753  ORF Transcript_2978/g.6753 Transcript_2978/m.6753 type:complete len:509 (+) Transcript_2978:137-1663(+)
MEKEPAKPAAAGGGGHDAADVEEVSQAVDRIGLGLYHIVILILAGGVYAVEAAIMLLAGFAVKTIYWKWELSPFMYVALAFILVVGIYVGTICGGFLSDNYGRRLPILTTYAGVAVSLCLMGLALNYAMILSLAFLLGLAMGLGHAACNTVVCESTPRKWQDFLICATFLLFAIGQIYAACIFIVLSPELEHRDVNWRQLLFMAAVPSAVFFVLAFLLLYESPQWLVLVGRVTGKGEAQDVLYSLARFNAQPKDVATLDLRNIPEVVAREQPVTDDVGYFEGMVDSIAHTWHTLLRPLFSRRYARITITMCFANLAAYFFYYGMIYGMPDSFKAMEKELDDDETGMELTPASAVLIAALAEIPGVIFAMTLGFSMGGPSILCITFGLTTVSAAALIVTLHPVMTWIAKMFITSAFIATYVFMLSAYPTQFRGTGFAFCVSVGRVGGLASPVLFEILMDKTGSIQAWFMIAALLCLLATIMVTLLRISIANDTEDEKQHALERSNSGRA